MSLFRRRYVPVILIWIFCVFYVFVFLFRVFVFLCLSCGFVFLFGYVIQIREVLIIRITTRSDVTSRFSSLQRRVIRRLRVLYIPREG